MPAEKHYGPKLVPSIFPSEFSMLNFFWFQRCPVLLASKLLQRRWPLASVQFGPSHWTLLIPNEPSIRDGTVPQEKEHSNCGRPFYFSRFPESMLQYSFKKNSLNSL